MNTHSIELSGYSAHSPEGSSIYLGTAGSHGNEQLQVTLGEDWEGLTVQVVFHPCKVSLQLPADGLLDVPWEATENPLIATTGRIVFQGFDQDRLVNSTDLAYAVDSHSSTVGRDEEPYTPGMVEGVLNQMAADKADILAAAQQAGQAKDAAAASAQEAAACIQKAADAAADAAAEATAAGVQAAADKAQEAADSAQAAAASAAKAEAIADELGQVSMDGTVMSVNGKTGRVQLEAADLPFDNAGTPFSSKTVQDAIEELLLMGGSGSTVSVIRVTAPAGAVVTVQKGAKVYTQTVGSDGAELSFMVLETGTWEVSAAWNDLLDARTINVAEAGGTYSVVLDFAPFQAYIHVTARAGAVVTASKGELVVSDTVTGSDVTLTVPDKGQWTLSATYDGGNAVPVVVDVQEEETTYEAQLHFLVLTVTAPAGAEVTAAKDGDTIQKTAAAGTVDLYLTGPGLWTVSAVYDGAASQQVTVDVSAGQDAYTAEPAFATLEVTAPAGSTIKAQNGQKVLTKTVEDGSVLFYLPALGTWDLTATLNGQTATSSVDCSAYQHYSAALAYFAASIKVTAVQGATVTASLDGQAVSGEAGSDGTVTLAVTKPGSYTVSATYSGASSNTKTVQVSQSGQQYTVSVEFITLTVTAPAGSTITAKNGATTLTDTGGTVKFYLPNTGTWTVSASLGSDSTSSEVQCSAYQNYSVELSYGPGTLDEMTWAEVAKLSAAGTLSDYFDVGDGKKIVLNGAYDPSDQENYPAIQNLEVVVFILGFNHNADREGQNITHWQIGKIGTKIISFYDNSNGPYTGTCTFCMDSMGMQNGWTNSNLRTNLGSTSKPTSSDYHTFYAFLPNDLKAVMRSSKKYTVEGNSNYYVISNATDYISIASEFEIFGKITKSAADEKNYQKQYQYYEAGNQKYSYLFDASNNKCIQILRSIDVTDPYTANYCAISQNGSITAVMANDYTCCFSPIIFV